MNQSNPNLELPEQPLPPELPADDTPPEPVRLGTLPTPDLPPTVDYHHVITLLTALLPDLDVARASAVHIDYQAVTVWYWDGQHEQRHTMPITHVQGSATEGGHPTTPPTGLTDLDGSDAQ